MPARTPRRIGMWLAIAVGIAAASMSASKHHKAERPASTANGAVHITLILPLN
ncbi:MULTISPECIES: hypothetical protein [unclassified Novosphingobium]|uniref:hypothetical protein n=1 Tax=unclassified Novosphingobium TaxID=2644732 RepID=UPI0013C337E1|nr:MULTISPECIES: hypothetical protein [unclassified Novosphingobium]NLR39400.1 hypothetical protein [Novosphingobium sp. ERW19]